MNHIEKCMAAALCLAQTACSPDESDSIQAVEGLSQGDGGLGAPLAYGVVATDSTVTSISLLGPSGDMLAQDFIHSGSASAGLVTAFSGDVALPTRSGDPRILTILDRFRTDVVTRVDPGAGEVLGQIKTHQPNDEAHEAAFSSNPQDYVYFGPHDAWVTRLGVNVDAAEDDPDRGVDLLHIDPTDFQRGDRISLWHLNGEGARENAETGETEAVTVYAQPSTMVRVDDQLIVGIAGLSLTYDAIGPGMVALVDPAEGSAEGFELPGLQNCDTVVPVADDPDRVVVGCNGFFRGNPRDSAGLALLALEGGALAIEHVWRGREHEDNPLAVLSVVSLGGTEVAASAAGEDGEDGEDENDVMYVVDLATGEQTQLFEAQGRYTIGSGAFDPERGLLLVPDASTGADGRPVAGVRTFERSDDGGFEAGPVVDVDPILPPRQVRPL